MVDKFLHSGEDMAVIGGGGQHQLAVAEGILHRLGPVLLLQAGNHYLGAALGPQLLRQRFHSLLRVAVNGGVGNHDALALHTVGRPDIIQAHGLRQCIAIQHRAMEGAYSPDLHCRRFFQQRLYLCAKFAHNTEIVAPCFAGPVLLRVQCAELTKAVGGKQHLIQLVIGDGHLRPVDHRRRQEGQRMAAQRQRVAIAHHNTAIGEIAAVKLLHHAECRLRGHHCRVGELTHKLDDVGGMIRLHMLHHQIVRGAARQRRRQIVQPFRAEMSLYSVHHRNLFVQNHIGIVGHAIGNLELSLKMCDLMVSDTDVMDILGDLHSSSSLSEKVPIASAVGTFSLAVSRVYVFFNRFWRLLRPSAPAARPEPGPAARPRRDRR